MLNTLDESISKNFDSNKSYMNNDYIDPDFMIRTPAVPWVDGMYVRFSTKIKRSLHEGATYLKYPVPRKYSEIKEALLKAYNLAKTFDVSAGIITDKGITSKILIISDQLFLSENKDSFVEFMEKCGYHYSCAFKTKKDGLIQYAMQFEAYRYRSNNFDVPEFLYHMTPHYNEESIIQNGILVSGPKNRAFEYPQRIYCFTVADGRLFKHFASQSDQYQSDADNIIKFVVFKIKTKKTNAVFFSDPNMPDDSAVYTYDDISSDAIVNVIHDSVKIMG